MRGRRYKRRLSAASAVSDAAYIANHLSWRGAFALGLVSFAAFYWAIPSWITHQAASLEGSRLQSVVSAVLARRIHYAEWLGIALLIACWLVAVWKYFTGRALSGRAERNVAFWSRLLGRRID
jgi:hypothetical protein